MLIDTHAHLNSPVFQEDLDEVIKKAQDVGVEKIICASSSVGNSEKAIEIAKKYPGIILAGCGIHPQQTDPENPDSIETQIKKLENLLDNKEVVAIGECGLDYSPAPPGEKDRLKEDQLLLFKKQIELAQKFNLPLIIHAREAVDETIEVLAGYKNIRGVFHCYYGGKKRIQKVLDLGFFFGFDGNLTYDPGLQNVAALIDIGKIILETDSPDLAPEPNRGSRNVPANVKMVAQCLAKLKNISLEEISKVTSDNANKLFNLL